MWSQSNSTLTWRERNVSVQQVTDFPYADTTKLVVKGSGQFDLKVRVPQWATRGFFVKVNGREQTIKAEPGSYVSLGRTWRANDTIELRMPFGFYLEPVMDQPNVASLFYGPVLLAAEESGPRTGATSRSTRPTLASRSPAIRPPSASPSATSRSSRSTTPSDGTRCIYTSR